MRAEAQYRQAVSLARADQLKEALRLLKTIAPESARRSVALDTIVVLQWADRNIDAIALYEAERKNAVLPEGRSQFPSYVRARAAAAYRENAELSLSCRQTTSSSSIGTSKTTCTSMTKSLDSKRRALLSSR